MMIWYQGALSACGALGRPVAPCETGVVGAKERLLQAQIAVSKAQRPVHPRLVGWD